MPRTSRAEFFDQAPDVLAEATSKEFAPETQCIGAARFARDALGVFLEAGDGVAQCLCGLLAEKDAGRFSRIQSMDGLSDASARIGDDRRSAGLCFQRSNAEILFCGEDEGASRSQQFAQSLARHFSDKFDIGTAYGARALRLGTIAGDDEAALRHRAKGLDDQIDPLVSHPVRS